MSDAESLMDSVDTWHGKLFVYSILGTVTLIERIHYLMAFVATLLIAHTAYTNWSVFVENARAVAIILIAVVGVFIAITVIGYMSLHFGVIDND